MDQVMKEEFKQLPATILEQERNILGKEVEQRIREEEMQIIREELTSDILSKSSMPEFKQELSNAEKRNIALKQELVNHEKYNELRGLHDQDKALLDTARLDLGYSKRMFRLYESLARCGE